MPEVFENCSFCLGICPSVCLFISLSLSAVFFFSFYTNAWTIYYESITKTRVPMPSFLMSSFGMGCLDFQGGNGLYLLESQ